MDKRVEIFLICCFGLLFSCSFPERAPFAQVQKDLEERNKIIEAHKSIEGVYEGNISMSKTGRQMPVKLTLTYFESIINQDKDGQYQYRARLYAVLSRPEILSYDVKLEGVYEPVTGDITLSSVEGEKEKLYFRTRVINESILATLKVGAQNYGVLDVRLTQKELPQDIDENAEQRNRIRKKLQILAGEYQAKVTPTKILTPGVKLGPFTAQTFSLRVAETSDRLPQLVLYWRKSSQFLVVQTPVSYKPYLDQEEISWAFPRGGGLQETFEFFGFLKDGVIQGEVVYPTFIGQLRAVKKKSTTSWVKLFDE